MVAPRDAERTRDLLLDAGLACFAERGFDGTSIRAIAAAYPDLPIQVGGGIRDEATIAAYLEAGGVCGGGGGGRRPAAP